MEIHFKIEEIEYRGVVTTVPKEAETQYFLDLGESLHFTIRINEHSGWETDNPDIDQRIVEAAGKKIEDLEYIPERNLN